MTEVEYIQPVPGAATYFAAYSQENGKPYVWMTPVGGGEYSSTAIESATTIEQAKIKANKWQKKENKVVLKSQKRSSMKKFKQEIATVAFDYNEDGTLESAVLWPKIKVTSEELNDQLGNCKNKTLDEVKQAAELMLGAFFARTNDVELRDMETTELTTEVVTATKYNDGTLRHVEIRFVFKGKQ